MLKSKDRVRTIIGYLQRNLKRTVISVTGIVLLMGFERISASETVQDTLPDNYLAFTLNGINNEFEGACEYFEGFRFTIILPGDSVRLALDSTTLMSLIQNRAVTGVLTSPNGKSTPIDFEIVNHREREDIYMKTAIGYFLWEQYKVHKDEINFVINWWYCPPATEDDLLILEMAYTLLTDSSHWHQDDDRKCDDDIKFGVWSLFCALKYASENVTHEYNHHNTAMQSVRSVINELVPDNDFGHTLMDFNNAPNTTHSDIVRVLSIARDRIRQELRDNED